MDACNKINLTFISTCIIDPHYYLLFYIFKKIANLPMSYSLPCTFLFEYDPRNFDFRNRGFKLNSKRRQHLLLN